MMFQTARPEVPWGPEEIKFTNSSVCPSVHHTIEAPARPHNANCLKLAMTPTTVVQEEIETRPKEEKRPLSTAEKDFHPHYL